VIFARLGVLSGEYTGWIGLLAPKKTPDDVLKSITDLALTALKGDAATKITGADYRPGSPTQPSFADYVKSEEALERNHQTNLRKPFCPSGLEYP
jgi:ABC-type proline/glycine betaine transport system substrate-binding protein